MGTGSGRGAQPGGIVYGVMMAYNHNSPTGEATQGDLRLFTALWPDEPVRRSLARHRDAQRWSGEARPVADANLHVTLVFLGQVPQSLLPALFDRLAAVSFSAIELCFDRIEHWGDGLIVLCPQRLPAALAQLHQRLQETSGDLGLPVESRAYRPHVTLARRARGSALIQPASPVRWVARDFVVAQSVPAEPYRFLRRFG